MLKKIKIESINFRYFFYIMDTIELFNHLIYQSNRQIIIKIVDKYKNLEPELTEQFLVDKFLSNKKLSIINDSPVKKKRGRPPKNKEKKLLIISD